MLLQKKFKKKLYFLLRKYKYFEKNCLCENTDKFIVQRYKKKIFYLVQTNLINF